MGKHTWRQLIPAAPSHPHHKPQSLSPTRSGSRTVSIPGVPSLALPQSHLPITLRADAAKQWWPGCLVVEALSYLPYRLSFPSVCFNIICLMPGCGEKLLFFRGWYFITDKTLNALGSLLFIVTPHLTRFSKVVCWVFHQLLMLSPSFTSCLFFRVLITIFYTVDKLLISVKLL